MEKAVALGSIECDFCSAQRYNHRTTTYCLGISYSKDLRCARFRQKKFGYQTFWWKGMRLVATNPVPIIISIRAQLLRATELPALLPCDSGSECC